MAEEIIASGKADMVAMNRALHADYDMPKKYAEGREWEHMPCLRCQCFRMASPHTAKLCSVNPMWGRVADYPEGCLPPAPVKKKVAVVGGGPAGVEAVKWLLQRGHDVTLYEKSGRIGGHVNDACGAPFKNDLRDYLSYMQGFAARCGAKILMNTKATPELLEKEGYNAVIVAIGADPLFPRVPGWDRPNVFWAPDAENGHAPCGQKVVIIGGASVGTEASITLAMEGKDCTVVELATEVDLLQNGKLYKTVTLTALTGWAWMEGNLPLVDTDLKPYEYSWLEHKPAAGYEVSNPGEKKGTVTTITNKHTPEPVDIAVLKVWDDEKNAAGIRPDSILVQLYANGDAYGEPYDPAKHHPKTEIKAVTYHMMSIDPSVPELTVVFDA